MNNEPVMEMCDEGHHKFYKLPDHPKNSLGNSVCPYCLVIGRQRLEAEIEALNGEIKIVSKLLIGEPISDDDIEKYWNPLHSTLVGRLK